MDYFSGLRKAFDSIESEMTRSLQGNNTQETSVEPHVIPVDDSLTNKVSISDTLSVVRFSSTLIKAVCS